MNTHGTTRSHVLDPETGLSLCGRVVRQRFLTLGKPTCLACAKLWREWLFGPPAPAGAPT